MISVEYNVSNCSFVNGMFDMVHFSCLQSTSSRGNLFFFFFLEDSYVLTTAVATRIAIVRHWDSVIYAPFFVILMVLVESSFE